MKTRSELLSEPEVTVVKDAHGQLESIHVRIREGKAAFATQPNPNALVFFELGGDRLPIGVTFLAPLKSGVAFTTLATFLCADPQGKPAGVDLQPVHHFVRDDEIGKVFRATTEAFRSVDAIPF